MPSRGKRGWGGRMLKRINYVAGVDSWDDAIRKILPTLNTPEIKQKEVELEAAQNNAQKNAQKDALKETQQQQLASQAVAGSTIQGLEDDPSDNPSQPGTSLQPDVDIGKTWFVDNFGITSGEMVDLLIKADKTEMVEIITPLIYLERRSILKHFSGVDPNLVKSLPLTDSDYDILNSNATRFDTHFRRFVKSWSDSETPDLQQEAYQDWRNRIDKSQRLSSREQVVLNQTSNILAKTGILNSKGIVDRGVSVSPAQLAGLIKSHGFLYGISSVGHGGFADKKALYYDVERGEAIVKDHGRLIAGLWESGGKIELDPRGTPRLILPFSSSNSHAYVDTLKSVMGVSAVRAEGSSILVEGNFAVSKACDSAYEHLKEKSQQASVFQKAFKGDERAIRSITYAHSSPKKQVILLKKWNISEADLEHGVI